MADGYTMRFDFGKLTGKLERTMKARLNRAGSELRRHVVQKISEGRTRVDGPSEPGTPPHQNTATLKRSIFHEVVGLTAIVGTTVDYGQYLEEGNSRMAARPYLRPSLDEMQPRIKKILSGK